MVQIWSRSSMTRYMHKLDIWVPKMGPGFEKDPFFCSTLIQSNEVIQRLRSALSWRETTRISSKYFDSTYDDLQYSSPKHFNSTRYRLKYFNSTCYRLKCFNPTHYVLQYPSSKHFNSTYYVWQYSPLKWNDSDQYRLKYFTSTYHIWQCSL